MVEIASVLDTGILGAVLGWFMFRLERVMKENTKVLIAVAELMRLIAKK